MSKTREIANRLLQDEITKDPGKYQMSTKAYRKLMTLCDLADTLCDEFDADGINVLLTPENGMEGIIQVDLAEMSFGPGNTHPFFTMIQSADYVGFSTYDGGVRLSLMVNNLWERN